MAGACMVGIKVRRDIIAPRAKTVRSVRAKKNSSHSEGLSSLLDLVSAEALGFPPFVDPLPWPQVATFSWRQLIG